jgi:hypothetical protein
VKSAARLPAEPRARALELVRRSLPNPQLQRMVLPADVEAEIQEMRNQRAEVYAALDDSSDRILTLREDIDRSGVVVDVVDDESSLVVAIDSARSQASASK